MQGVSSYSVSLSIRFVYPDVIACQSFNVILPHIVAEFFGLIHFFFAAAESGAAAFARRPRVTPHLAFNHWA